MATARELLEQADALMRRNRANTLDDIPVLTEVMPAVAFSNVARPAARPVDPGPPSVPLLTENIDVVDEDATLDAEAVEGEPSAWLEFEDANPSVIGDAPDSIAIVPPVEMRVAPPDAALLASAEHEEIEFTLPVEEVPAGEGTDEVAAAAADDEFEASAKDEFEAGAKDEFEAGAADTMEIGTEDAFEAGTNETINVAADEAIDAGVEAADPADAEEAVAADAGNVIEDAVTADADNAIDEAVAADAERAIEDAYAAASVLPPAAEAIATPPPAIALPLPMVVPAAPAMADDDERWVAAAEEIRMQVLQRIDLFTDTGLRDQLSQRLQPIADRASADFVAAINLHVGDLLRTYVAEAIEREIERWRRDH